MLIVLLLISVIKVKMPTCCVGGEDDGKSRLLRLKGESGRCIGASRSVRSIRDFCLRGGKHGRRRGSGGRRRRDEDDWMRETEEEIKEAATASVGASTLSTRGGSATAPQLSPS